ncbi:unnamed protein product [Spirodela intermedia]|uniref:DYW domain-containing protein n=1 Tax=Spirodela intermedia TaxID=51605 RepID=A0A7I8KBN9_SPIIN|nr:unnamed protein product [Spirodela intermedia]
MSSCSAPVPRQAFKLRPAHPLPRSSARAAQTLHSRRRRRGLASGGGAAGHASQWQRELRRSVDGERLSPLLNSSSSRGEALKSRVISLPILCSEVPPSYSMGAEEIPVRTAALYASLIGSLVRAQQWRDALSAFASMVGEDLKPDRFLLPKILKACSELERLNSGAAVHGYMLKRWQELQVDAFVGNSMIDMYGKCGDLASARKMFDEMPHRDVVSWTALLMAYTAAGQLEDAAEVFSAMRAEGVKPDLISWNALISGFARKGETSAALGLLEAMREDGVEPCTNSWNGVLSGFAQSGCFEDAIDVFMGLRSHGGAANPVTIAAVLPACSGLRLPGLGRALHAFAIKNGFSGNVFIDGAVIDMYMKCGDWKDAEQVFSSMEKKTAAVWNEMVAGWANQGELEKAMEFLKAMAEDGLKPDVITYNTVLAAYARNGKKDEAFRLVSEMGKMNLKPNIVSINALIAGFQQRGLSKEALGLLRVLQRRGEPHSRNSSAIEDFPSEMLGSSIKLNAVTVTSVLAACSDLKVQHHGMEVHGFILRNSLESNVFVSAALIDMYAKCENMANAVKVFCGARERNTVTWNTMMAGYNSSGEPANALKLFPQMLRKGHAPSSVTLLILLRACSTMAALTLGRALHGHAVKGMLHDPSFFGIDSTLIDMYAKCGSIQEARLVFDSTSEKDLAAWNTMISGYSLHGMAEDSIALFKEMYQSGMSPDRFTFTSILSACRQEGFMEVGWKYFNSMEEIYGVKPELEHFTCMVGIMGGAGLLEEALNFIRRMPFEPDACIWAALLRACRAHSDHEIGQEAAAALFELEPRNASNYIILSNIYTAVGMWDSAMDVRLVMRSRGLKPPATCSWVNLRHKAHAFEAGGRPHPEIERILEEWDRLALEMERLGYFPQDPCLVKEETDPFSCFHTEKLAICYGLISLPAGCPVRVSKNVRMCIDCHTSAKFISRIGGREVLVRDGCLYHHFAGGVCSCGDSW